MSNATNAATTSTEAAADATSTAATTDTAETTGTSADTITDLEAAKAEIAKWKGHARTWETRAAENKSAKEALDQIEAEKLTTEQRLTQELEAARTELATAQATALKNSVAAATGVPAALLTGNTQEELEATAAALLAFKGTTPPPANDAAASGPQGAPITGGNQILSRDELANMSRAERLAAVKDGRLDTLMGRK